MSFLQINNPDGTSGIKRPFRLSDIQDIWNGIKSLFKAVSGQQFRIISGFDLVNGTYTSGAVWYNGELYEYDSNAYPITPSTTRVAFTRVAQDERDWEGGDILPFSYKYVCGGDTLSGSAQFTYFVRDIEKYKSYLGNGSVTTEKLANSAVTREKIAGNERIPFMQALGPVVVVTSDFSLSDHITPQGLPYIGISANAPATIIVTSRVSEDDPAIVFMRVISSRTTPTTLGIGESSITIPAYTGFQNTHIITLVKEESGNYYNYIVAGVMTN
jgi:hypothetical protein